MRVPAAQKLTLELLVDDREWLYERDLVTKHGDTKRFHGPLGTCVVKGWAERREAETRHMFGGRSQWRITQAGRDALAAGSGGEA